MAELEPVFKIKIPWYFSIRNRLQQLPPKIFDWFADWKIVVSAAVSIFLIVFGINLYQKFSPPLSLSKLAAITPHPYAEIGLRHSKTQADRLFQTAMQYYTQADYTTTINFLQELLLSDETNGRAHFYIGICYLMQQSQEQVQQHFEKSLQLNYGQGTSHWYLAQLYLLKKDKPNAVKNLEKEIELSDNMYSGKAKRLLEKLRYFRN